MGNIHTTGPNEALIVSGGCCGGSDSQKIAIGGWAWAWWLVTGKLGPLEKKSVKSTKD